MRFEQFTEASDKGRAMQAAVISGSNNPMVSKQADAGEKQMKAIDSKAKAENQLVDAQRKAKEKPSTDANKAVKDARDKVQMEKKKVEAGQRALEDSKKAILNQDTTTPLSKEQRDIIKAKQDALREKTTKFFSEVKMKNTSKLNFLINKVENFAELSEDPKVKETMTDLAEAVQSENIDEVPKAADKVIESVEEKCVTFSDRLAASDIIKVLKSFSADDGIDDIKKIVNEGGSTQGPDDSAIPSEANMDTSKIQNFTSVKKDPRFLIKAGIILKKAARESGKSIKAIAAAEKLFMAFPTPADMVNYLKKTYTFKSKIPWSKVSKAIKKFQALPQNEESTYRAALYDYCGTGLGLATIYDAVPSAKSFFSGLKNLDNDLKEAAAEIQKLGPDNTEGIAAFSDADSPADKPDRPGVFRRFKAWADKQGHNIATSDIGNWLKDHKTEAALAGITVATLVSFISLNKKIGTLKERLRNTDDPEERADINKKLKKMKMFLTAMVMGTAVAGALEARKQIKKHPDANLRNLIYNNDNFTDAEFEDEIGHDDESKEDDEPEVPPVEDAEFEDEDTPPTDSDNEEDDSDKILDDIKDAEVAIGPSKFAEFSKNLRKYVKDPTNKVLKKKVLSQFSLAMDEAVYEANFADFTDVAGADFAGYDFDEQQNAQPVAPAPTPEAAPAGATPPPSAPADTQVATPAPAPAPEAATAGATPPPSAQVDVPPADPNAAAAPAPVEGQPVDPGAQPDAAATQDQPQGDGTSESDIVIDKREVQNFSKTDTESYGSYMAKFARL